MSVTYSLLLVGMKIVLEENVILQFHLLMSPAKFHMQNLFDPFFYQSTSQEATSFIEKEDATLGVNVRHLEEHGQGVRPEAEDLIRLRL